MDCRGRAITRRCSNCCGNLRRSRRAPSASATDIPQSESEFHSGEYCPKHCDLGLPCVATPIQSASREGFASPSILHLVTFKRHGFSFGARGVVKSLRLWPRPKSEPRALLV